MMNSSWTRLLAGLFLLFGLALFSGCASYSTAHTATPIEKGQVETSVRASYYGLQTGSSSTGTLRGGLPSFEFAGRYGISKNVDVGAKVFPVGIGVDANIAVINQEAFAFSVNPAVSYVGLGSAQGTGAGYGMAFTNLLADVVKTESFTLTTGLKPGLFYAYGSAQGQFGGAARFGLGGTLGAKIWAGENIAFTPWVDVVAPVGVQNGSLIFYNGMLGVNIAL